MSVRHFLNARWIFFGLLLLLTQVMTADPSFADHDYYHGKYRDRETLIKEDRIAKAVITLLEERYPQGEISSLVAPFIPTGSIVPFETVKSLISTEPLLCQIVKSNRAYQADLTISQSGPRLFQRFEIDTSVDAEPDRCHPEAISLGPPADAATSSKLTLKPFRDADKWVLEALPDRLRKKVNRVKVYGNEDGEVVGVIVYERLTGIWRFLAEHGPQQPAPNGEYDWRTFEYNFAFQIGVLND